MPAEPDFVLTAGPAPASAKMLRALGTPVTYQYDPFFEHVFRRAESLVQAIFCTQNNVVLMQGEAVLGLEAAVRAVAGPGTRCLSLVSGLFGKGFTYWLQGLGATVHEVEVPWNDSIDPADVERALRDHPEVEVVTVVHSETPSGTLNPLAEIGPIVHDHGAMTVVDCVSSLAGMCFLPDDWKLDICAAGPHKCLSGPAGISLVSVSERAWERILQNHSAPRDSYVSLLDWKIKWIENGQFPYIPSISDVYGLLAVCEEFVDEGAVAVRRRHETAARAARAGARAMGLELWPRSDDISSTCVTVIELPEALTDVQVRDHARHRYGVMLSDGEGATDRVIRIGHMGAGARSMNPVVGLAAVGRTLLDLGTDLRLGAGLVAATDVLAEAATVADGAMLAAGPGR